MYNLPYILHYPKTPLPDLTYNINYIHNSSILILKIRPRFNINTIKSQRDTLQDIYTPKS